MARSARCTRHRRKQTFSRSRSVADRNLRAAVSSLAGWTKVEALLRNGIGRNRDRSFGRGDSSGRTCLAYAHAKSDGLSKQAPRATGAREAIFASRRRPSGNGGNGTGYTTQIVRGNQHIFVAATRPAAEDRRSNAVRQHSFSKHPQFTEVAVFRTRNASRNAPSQNRPGFRLERSNRNH